MLFFVLCNFFVALCSIAGSISLALHSMHNATRSAHQQYDAVADVECCCRANGNFTRAAKRRCSDATFVAR